MQLSLHADYSLRALIYLATQPDRIVRTQDISEAYNISKHHLVRVVQTLAQNGYVKIHAGRSGGLSLHREAGQIRIGDVVRVAEPNLRLVECFDPETNTCKIAPACALKGMLREALDVFITSLNRYTLADIAGHGRQDKLTKIFAGKT
jgi:Rrf2 family nitric oxide-sensitive transcriptional repressor